MLWVPGGWQCADAQKRGALFDVRTRAARPGAALCTCLMAAKIRLMSDSGGKTEYLCGYLNANKWDSVRTKTAFSTFEGAALAISRGRLVLVVPQRKKPSAVAATAPVAEVQLEFPALTKIQNTALVINFGTKTRWMVDFGLVWNRKRVRKPNGKISYAKAFFFPELWNFKSIGEGKKLRQEFIDAVTARGGQLAL